MSAFMCKASTAAALVPKQVFVRVKASAAYVCLQVQGLLCCCYRAETGVCMCQSISFICLPSCAGPPSLLLVSHKRTGGQDKAELITVSQPMWGNSIIAPASWDTFEPDHLQVWHFHNSIALLKTLRPTAALMEMLTADRNMHASIGAGA